MSRFGGVTLEEASSAWFKDENSHNSTNTLNNNSTNTLDTITFPTTHESNDALGAALGSLDRIGERQMATVVKNLEASVAPARRSKATSRRRTSARELIDLRKIQSRAAKFPRDWPQSRLGPVRKRSCGADTVVLPCVKKAVSHLELLQTAIEEWFQENPDFVTKDSSARGLTRLTRAGGRSTWQREGGRSTWHSALTLLSKPEVDRDDDFSVHTFDSGESLEVMEETRTPFVPQQQQQPQQQPSDSAASKKSTIQQIEINVKEVDHPSTDSATAAETTKSSGKSAQLVETDGKPARADEATATVKVKPGSKDAAAAAAGGSSSSGEAVDAPTTTNSVDKDAKTPVERTSGGQSGRQPPPTTTQTARATRQTHVSKVPPLSSIASSINFDEENDEEDEERAKWDDIIDEEEEEEEGEARFQLPEINAEDIVTSTTQLLRRLEEDREKLEARLRQEQQLILHLQQEIDALMIQRMKDLPIAVQREHESCMLDVTELQWHVNYRGRVKTRTNKKVNKAKEYNTKLRTELEHISKQGPLIQEKLGLLSNAMVKIAAGQETLEKLLSEEQSNYAKMESRSAETRNKAQMERGLMVKEQRSLTEELGRYEKDLVRARDLHDQLNHEWNSFDAKMTQAKASAEALELRLESVTASEEQLETEIRDLQIKIREQELEASRVSESNESATKEKNREEDTWRQEAESLEMTLKQKTLDLQNVMKGIKDYKGEIDETLEHIRTCQQDKVTRIKNQESHQKEISKNEEQIEFVKLELEKADKVHDAIGGRLDVVNQKIVAEENELRFTATDVRTQTKDERQSKMSLNAKILTDRDDYDKLQKEAGVKMEKIRKKATEVESVVDGLNQKVEKLRNSHEEKAKVVAMLEDQMRHIATKQGEKEDELNKSIGELEPVATQLIEKQTEFGNKQKHIEARTAEIRDETQAMESEEVDLNEELQHLEVEVESLEADLKEMQTQYSSSDRILHEYQRLFDENQRRMQEMQQTHAQHIKIRQQVMEEHKRKLASEKVSNVELASSYRRLVGAKLQHKSQCMDTFDRKNRVENSLKDLRLLRLLQERMSTALQVYYRLRGLYGSDVVAEFKDESKISSNRMDELKGEMGNALGKIDSFLKVFAQTA